MLDGRETPCGMSVLIFLAFNYLNSRKETQLVKCPFTMQL